jgi:tripartite-type tricarboxylate transporter receptor subunit TctC
MELNVSAQTSLFEGKTVRILVGFSRGGAYDIWARVIAQYMGKYILGNPAFVVQNMTGGGSMVAASCSMKSAGVTNPRVKPYGLAASAHW